MSIISELSNLKAFAPLPQNTSTPTRNEAEAAPGEEAATEGSATPSATVRLSNSALLFSRLFGGKTDEEAATQNHAPNALFDKYAPRLDKYLRNFYTADDKKLVGEAYQMAEEKGVKPEKIDKLARELGALRIRQQLAGQLVLSTAKDGDEPRQVDIAHMGLLGEMHRMSGL
jgi:hypothetical protein